MPRDTLWRAVGHNDVTVVRDALAKGANLTVRDADGNTLLHLAAGCEEHGGDSYEEVIDAMIEAGADLNARDGDGATFLLKVVQRCAPELVRRYLAAGADPNIPDDFGTTPLMAAI